MVYGIANKTIKLFLFTTNLLTFVFGGLLFSFSLWANLDRNFSSHLRDFTQKIKLYNELVDKVANYQSCLWILVAVGALLLVVGFLGCCGAACESLVLLSLFSILILILSLIELYVLISLFTNRSELLENLHSAFVKSAETPEGRKNLKPIEDLLQCCGATIETKSIYIKENLCPGQLENKGDCYSSLINKIDSMGNGLLFCGILLLIIQFFSIMFSNILCKAFQEHGPINYA
ncbi:Tetraspanin [Meloidogyne graminicola]|uniref:Tetraspanin n=1 Tax=Meloidogyne graminicola TaxID=189291 RepID=A0A8S9ZKF5_9BILA|nr:Tetraspanin [Meloidogyne graminicola]